MESCHGELHLSWCIIYLDDITVFSQTPEEHPVRLQAVFNKLKTAGLKLKPSKCELFRKQINYLGHVVGHNRISTNPKKIEVVTEWPRPTTVTEVMLCNVLPINWYIGNITIKCHSKSMGDNRDPTVVLHQEISSLPVSIASDTRCF